MLCGKVLENWIIKGLIIARKKNIVLSLTVPEKTRITVEKDEIIPDILGDRSEFMRI